MSEMIELLENEIVRVSGLIPQVTRAQGKKAALFLKHDMQRARKAIDEANPKLALASLERLQWYESEAEADPVRDV
ncbi:hypothetical protein [Larkinella rosea]|uniref:Uncharacterized protein n=1 Tax=Larkinella rosea TaxID=2025312 RepID=A0A3P1BYW9_9BACT|nr:hypothetical protein [Larkinella rosea]RRB06291.1 hypothetical protein EHT25_00350 [Larkinella rosea]